MCRKILQKDTLYLITLVFDQGPNKQIKPRGLLFSICITLLLHYYPLIFFNKIYFVTKSIYHDNQDDFERIFIT